MNARHRKELRRFLKQWKAIPINDQFKEAADRVNELIPALIDSISDEELDTLMMGLADYMMTSIITSPFDKKVEEAQEHGDNFPGTFPITITDK